MSTEPSQDLRDRYVDQLVEAGHLHSRPWIEAFRAVPRHPFVPRVFRRNEAGEYEALDSTKPAWLPLVYSNAFLTTQISGYDTLWLKALSSPVNGAPTSSSSQPSLMADMLEALEMADGHRVLEIGTGTGYNAALMCHRLGSAQVTTIEADAGLCAEAQTTITRCGYTPTVVCGDGAKGHEPGAPYDRIIATCSVPAIPIDWVKQTRPGGLILASLFRPLGGGPLARLTVVNEDTAEGRFLPGGGGFMPSREVADVDTMTLFRAATRGQAGRAPRSTAVAAEMLSHSDFGMLAALVLPDVTTIEFTPDGGSPQRWLLAAEGDWACLDTAAGTVTEHGSRRLWTEVETAHETWQRAGRPPREQVGLTVAPDRQFVWLDDPDGSYSWPMPL